MPDESATNPAEERPHAVWRMFNRGAVGMLLLVAAVVVLLLLGLYVGLQAWQFTEATQLRHLDPHLPREDALALASTQLAAASTRIAAWDLVVQLLGALALAITLFFTAWNIRQANEQLDIARVAQAETRIQFERTLARQDVELRLALQGQMTERFTRATDQLGSDSLMTRLGGIRSLARIAQESADDHGPIMEMLSAYVRQHAAVDVPLGRAPTDGVAEQGTLRRPRKMPRVSEDIQTIMVVLSERNPAHRQRERGLLNLQGVMLNGAQLSNANLSGLDLSGARLIWANLTEVDLTGSTLAKAVLIEAVLFRARLAGADLIGADMSGGNLREARLFRSDLTGANLSRADLSAGDLSGAYLTAANLTEANLTGADVTGTDLFGANLSGATLHGVHGLTQNQIDVAHMDDRTKLPDHPGPDGRPYQRASTNPENQHDD